MSRHLGNAQRCRLPGRDRGVAGMAAATGDNDPWMDEVMSQGMRIVDIGRDPAKVQAGAQLGERSPDLSHK